MDGVQPCSQFVFRLREETKIYNNFPGIIEKVERDGHLETIYNCLDGIFESEMVFAITRRLKRAEKNEKQHYEGRHKEVTRDKSLYF
jgi:hypothetical protein